MLSPLNLEARPPDSAETGSPWRIASMPEPGLLTSCISFATNIGETALKSLSPEPSLMVMPAVLKPVGARAFLIAASIDLNDAS